jgi:murein DD-endopeptidase MepM/ murein hydrolase activator NlpD
VRGRVLGGLLAAAAAAAAVLVPAAPAKAPARASARAAVIGGTLGSTGSVRAQGDAQRSALTRSAPPGIVLSSGEATALAVRGTGDATARATAVARSVSLLGGAVTAYGVRRSALDAGDGSGTTYRGAVHGLVVDGRALGDARAEHSYDLGGRGVVEVNRGGAGLRVTLTAPLDGFAAGTTVLVADVSAAAADGANPAATPAPTPTPNPTPTPKPSATATKTATARPAHAKPPPKRKPKPDDFRRRLAGPGFVFPVRGPTRIGGPFGAARADTGAHEGNDLFAAFGTPVVAVADGTIGRVGTLVISGNRLWLTTRHGDAFFYAHLSAFSPNAVDGRRVKAGTLLGYVGNTGDAEPTPPHLHFEIHPNGGAAVDPHPTLVVWQARAHVPPPDTATRPGALLEVRDLIADG